MKMNSRRRIAVNDTARAVWFPLGRIDPSYRMGNKAAEMPSKSQKKCRQADNVTQPIPTLIGFGSFPAVLTDFVERSFYVRMFRVLAIKNEHGDPNRAVRARPCTCRWLGVWCSECGQLPSCHTTAGVGPFADPGKPMP